MVLERESILNLLTENIAEIKKFGIKSIGVFGSAARNELKISSDIDFIVVFEENKISFDNYMELKFYLEDLFKRDIDLVTKSSLKPIIRDKILKEVVYAA